MPLSPRLYHWFVRPQWVTRKYIHDHIKSKFHLENKFILDFGSGTGANCSICHSDQYFGIEPDMERIYLAKKLYPNYNFKIFDTHQIPIQNCSIDYIFVIAVLHHITDQQIKEYLLEFKRILKPGGNIIVMEPYLCERRKFNNRFMNWYDDGRYIRSEKSYLDLFQAGQYECEVIQKFTKCLLYNEIFFSAVPITKQY
ncbi:Methyltransferase domain-containing protein [Fontibacillus panacisegetis]|uniref:Methyltransferase domain-containing protein n=1 Tax=Fontibacillus panacisegetis TaxID=670482 RepID=A0A1G7V4C1_9BACL|nr:class I SAM-dependent methyltransferase [Fontibacillus panacisegetis]SDG54361.1 Methyltransferase domain-containing protein [Fontibacillus panacisegetis]